MNRITTAESSVVHKVQTTDQQATPRADVLQGKLVLDTQSHELHGPLVHSMFVPMHYERNYAYPLVVWLHGDADDERQLHRIMPFLSLRNFVAAAPRGRPHRVNSAPESGSATQEADKPAKVERSAAAHQSAAHQSAAPQPSAPQPYAPQPSAPRPNAPGTAHEAAENEAADNEASDNEASDNESVAHLPGGLVVSASQRGFSWDLSGGGVEHAVESIAAAIEHASTRANINPQKIVLVGFESGATMALQVGLQHPERYAGIVAIGGGLPNTGRPLASLSQARHLPLLLCQGRYSEAYHDEKLCHDLRLLHIGGFSVTLRQYPCGDDLVDLMLKDANSWIMERVTGGLIS